MRLNGQRVKPAHAVRIGDTLLIERGAATEKEFSIASIPQRRGPASEAARAYVETVESIERAKRAAEVRALRPVLAPPTAGRPDKRTRRLLLRVQRGPLSRE